MTPWRSGREVAGGGAPFDPMAPRILHLLLSALTGALSRLVSRPRCAACDELLPAPAIFCAHCASTVVLAEPRSTRGGGGGERASCPPDEVDGERLPLAPFVYGGAVAELLTRFKYTPASYLAAPAYGLLQRALPPLRVLTSRSIWIACPVPLHRHRLAERGFNQAALLARALARDLGIAFDARLLTRERDTPRQASLDRRARLANVDGAFRWRSPSRLHGRCVVLVDDVVTTGATLRACARALLAAGATAVQPVAIAVTVTGADAASYS
jgi:ComF family protein